MKNIIQKNIFENICSLLIFTFLITACVNSQSSLPQSSPPQSSPKQNTSEMCEHIKIIIQNEVKGKTSSDSITLFSASKNKKEAFGQAQSLAIKLNARFEKKNGDVTTYFLPEENAKIQIVEKNEDDCVYVILYLQVSCTDYPVKEIRYMPLRCYHNL